MYYASKIKHAVEAAFDKQPGLQRKDLLSIKAVITKELFAEETDEVKKLVEAEHDSMYERETTEWLKEQELQGKFSEASKE